MGSTDFTKLLFLLSIAQRLEWRGQTQFCWSSTIWFGEARLKRTADRIPAKWKFSTHKQKENRINILLIVHHLTWKQTWRTQLLLWQCILWKRRVWKLESKSCISSKDCKIPFIHVHVAEALSNKATVVVQIIWTVWKVSLVVMSEKLCLQWNDFKENANCAFGSLRNDKDFTDVTLACEDGQQMEAHKVILASSSPFFQKILQKSKHHHPLIYLRGFQSNNFLSILDFLYSHCSKSAHFGKNISVTFSMTTKGTCWALAKRGAERSVDDFVSLRHGIKYYDNPAKRRSRLK